MSAVRLALRGLLVLKARKACRVREVFREKQAQPVLKANAVRRVSLVRWDPLVLRVSRAHVACRESKVLRASKVSKALPVRTDVTARMAQTARTATRLFVARTIGRKRTSEKSWTR